MIIMIVVGCLCFLTCTMKGLDDFYYCSRFAGFKRGADPGMPEPTVLSLLWG
ncbi:TOMM7 isoform 6 [Pongo abelii]|uniref:TOMM7 isoform 6 n=1 Tax=Pongo abelii TaxID=9601 RepID=A0A2J8VE62_PONAB|nr:TOMM7 isoform 6 [Pongo abelii]